MNTAFDGIIEGIVDFLKSALDLVTGSIGA